MARFRMVEFGDLPERQEASPEMNHDRGEVVPACSCAADVPSVLAKEEQLLVEADRVDLPSDSSSDSPICSRCLGHCPAAMVAAAVTRVRVPEVAPEMAPDQLIESVERAGSCCTGPAE